MKNKDTETRRQNKEPEQGYRTRIQKKPEDERQKERPKNTRTGK